MSDYIRHHSIATNYKIGESWVILNEIEQSIKTKIELNGTPLKNWDIKINRGILTGLNDAFIIDKNTRDILVESDPKSAEIIRPIIRGRDIKKHQIDFNEKYLIALFPSKKYNIDDYPAIKNWLINGNWVTVKTKGNPPTPIGSGKLRLQQTGQRYEFKGVKFKSRKKTSNKWFEVQDSIGYWEDFYKQHIVWKAVGKQLGIAIAEPGVFISAPGSLITSNTVHLQSLLALLHSNLFKYQLIKSGDKTGAGDLMINVQSLGNAILPQPDKHISLGDNAENYIALFLDLSNEEIEYIKQTVESF